jgi:CheY-like chemotaxis protein
VLDSTVKLTQNELRHRARLTRDYQPVPLVNADEARLGQLFLNLLVNALQALPMDSSPEATEIRVATRTASDGAAVVDIADSGVGIPQELLDRVFEPFFTTKPADVGTGLGLSICRSIVTGLGGTIEIQSEPGGTLCRVILPAAPPMTAPPEREPRPLAPASGRRPRLLLVDDEERLLCAIAEQLSAEFEVVSTASGDAAIDILIERDFDAVVCDLMMPGTSGADVYEAARGHRPGIEKRFIFMTGGAFTTSTRRFLQTVDSPRLDKPFDVAELSAMVRRLLAER